MMNRTTFLLVIVLFNLLSTWLHYTDNAIYVDHYLQPAWFTTWMVFAAITIMTPIGLLNDGLYRQNRVLIVWSIGIAQEWKMSRSMNG
jgi:hypothetical protein